MKFNIIFDGRKLYINGRPAARNYHFCNRKIYTWGEYILKFDVEDNQSSAELLFVESILLPEDRTYFTLPVHGRVADDKTGFIIEKKEQFRRGKYPQWAIDRVRKLAVKYQLFDIVTPNYNEPYPISVNWGITIDGLVKIYDYGLYAGAEKKIRMATRPPFGKLAGGEIHFAGR